jgi:hypothetical protein
MIDLTSEQPLRLDEAARIVGTGRRGKPTHISTVLRWILRGVPGPGGRRIRLRASRLGSHWVTSREALTEFTRALTPTLDAEPAAAPRTANQRERAAAAVGRRLERVGIR